jgi:hypothetical protein
MNCPHCGSERVPDEARFCPYCREPISLASVPGPEVLSDTEGGTPVPSPDFADFQLRAWLHDEKRVLVMVHNSPAGDMRRPVGVPINLDQLRSIRKTVDRIQWRGQSLVDDYESGVPSTGRRWMVELGRELANVLLPRPVFALLLRSLERVASDGLRIRLCLDESLVDLPWEFIYRPDLPDQDTLDGFLALDSRISLVREPPLATPQAQPPGEKQHMVFAGAPFGVGERDLWGVEDEYQELSDALVGVRDLLSLEYVDAAGEHINTALMKSVSMFHYSGHTDLDDDRGFLVQEIRTSPGESADYRVWEHPSYADIYGVERLYVDLLYSEALAGLLRRAGVRLAVFSACNSGRWPFVRPLLQAGLPALIGVQGQVSPQGAIAFCHKLYSSLAIGLSLDEAVTWARLHLLEPGVSPFKETYEWGSFMVYMPSAQAVLFPQPEERELWQRQEYARRERQRTIINVYQTIGSVVGGNVVGVDYDPS